MILSSESRVSLDRYYLTVFSLNNLSFFILISPSLTYFSLSKSSYSAFSFFSSSAFFSSSYFYLAVFLSSSVAFWAFYSCKRAYSGLANHLACASALSYLDIKDIVSANFCFSSFSFSFLALASSDSSVLSASVYVSDPSLSSPSISSLCLYVKRCLWLSWIALARLLDYMFVIPRRKRERVNVFNIAFPWSYWLFFFISRLY